MSEWALDALDEMDRAGLVACALLRVGSHSHGTHVAPDDPLGVDDTDVMVVLAPNAADALGFSPTDDFRHQEGNLDLFAYSWGKFVRLLVKSNPNVLCALWMPMDCEEIPVASPFRILREGRAAFVSKQAHQSFVGYARAQLHKMKSQAYQGYMGAKRKALVDRFGYDTKNAAHLIRLLRSGIEFLRRGELVVRRPDAAELIEIKRGGWTLDRVEQESVRLFAAADAAWAESILPERPDMAAARRMMLRGYGIEP